MWGITFCATLVYSTFQSSAGIKRR